GQSRIVANFLLAWWNAASCGGFDLTDLWAVDTSIAEDMLAVIVLVSRQRRYPDDLGYGKQFESIVRVAVKLGDVSNERKPYGFGRVTGESQLTLESDFPYPGI